MWIPAKVSGLVAVLGLIGGLLLSANPSFAQDTDLDGLTDAIEAIVGSDPNDSDTDDDGLEDGDELAALHDLDRVSAVPLTEEIELSRAIRIGDVDNDGDNDIVTGLFNATQRVVWFENLGGGEFEERPIESATSQVVAILAIDFDGDQDLDVVAGSFQRRRLTSYENLGGGEFGPQRDVSADTEQVFSLASGDLNGDDRPDILVARDRTVAWHESFGDGTFGSQNLVYTIPSTRHARSVNADDLDGDGILDVLAVLDEVPRVVWFRGLGSGNFGPPLPVDSDPIIPDNISAADIDGDGELDVLFEAFEGIRWARNLGGGLFAPAIVVSGRDGGVASLVVSDLDLDGDLDLVHTAHAGFSGDLGWNENLGGGVFGPTNVIEADYFNPSGVDAGDLDGNGYPDLVFNGGNSDEAVIWIRNPTPSPLVADSDSDGLSDADEVNTYQTSSADPDSDDDGLPDRDEVLVYGTNPNLVDSDADGISDPDEINLHGTNPSSEDSDADGLLDLFEITFGFDPLLGGQQGLDGDADGLTNLEEQAAGSNPLFADIDGDGLLDGEEVNVHSTDPNDADSDDDGLSDFDEVITYGTNPQDPDSDGDLLGDLEETGTSSDPNDADSDDDGLTDGDELLRIGELRTFVELSRDLDAIDEALAADLDGDGDPDVVAIYGANRGGPRPSIGWFENDGRGGFDSRGVILTSFQAFTDIHAADLDDDGRIDLLSGRENSALLGFHRNLGSGDFAPVEILDNSGGTLERIATADLDGDGTPDIVAGYGSEPTVRWYRNLGGGHFDAAVALAADTSGLRDLIAVDIDEDLDSDIIFSSSTDNSVFWLENLGGGNFAARQTLAADVAGATLLFTADVDDDGDQDFTVSASTGEGILFFENQGAGKFASARVLDDSRGASDLDGGDLDGDGDFDLTYNFGWFANDGRGGFAPRRLLRLRASSSGVLVDIDSDGALDVLGAERTSDLLVWHRNLVLDPTDPDTDNDGLSDGDEVNTHFTDPRYADTDRDGASDGDELNIHGTDPFDPDVDGDGLLDGFETAFGFDPHTPGEQLLDSDSDGLHNLEEQTAGTSPLVSDTDADGLSDFDEVTIHLSDPNDSDSDDDGLPDGDEVNLHFTDPALSDTDSDGLSDPDEINNHFTDPTDPDTDDDQLNDGDEIAIGTDPFDSDTDDDFLSDGLEINMFLSDPFTFDTDGDGLGDGLEAFIGIDPILPDTDGDGLTDGDERLVYGTNPGRVDTDIDGINDFDEIFVHGTDPNEPDTDNDGLIDGDELDHGTDPLTRDSDGDGLFDGTEVHTHGTDPTIADTDADGLSDRAEVRTHFTNPLVADTDDDGLDDGDEVNVHLTLPGNPDTDGDLLPDGFEVLVGLNPLNGADGTSDQDDDGLDNASEFSAGTDLTNPDTDGDGLRDGDEVHVHLTDPTTSDSDYDGLTDPEELFVHNTDPIGADTDLDRLPDGDEIDAGTDPLIADVDADGVPDFWEVNAGTDHANADTDADGLSDGEERRRVRTLGFGEPTFVSYQQLDDFVVVDLNEDGKNDIVGCERNVIYFEGVGDGTFERGRSLTEGASICTAIAVEDVDGVDGPDILVRNPVLSLLRNLGGDLNFSAPEVIASGFISDIQLVDLTNNGRNDILILGSTSGWVENLGGGTFGTMQPFDLSRTSHLSPADLDGDGDLDIVADGRSLYIVENRGDGDFAPPRIIVQSFEDFFASTAADLDGDGDTDVVAAQRTDELLWYANDGTGNFGGAQIIPASDNVCPDPNDCIAEVTMTIRARDLDQDGDFEVITSTRVQEIVSPPTILFSKAAWFENLGGGAFGSERTLVSDREGVNDIRAAMLDGDGDLDLIWTSNRFDIDFGNFQVGERFAQIVTHMNPGTDAANPDSDADGLTDGEETLEHATDPNDADSDDDGLSDRSEINKYESDPNSKDTDGDGLPDSYEVKHGFDLTKTGDGPLDPDLDGLGNRRELASGTNPTRADSDRDGRDDGEELDIDGTDPLQEDTDADGLNDRLERKLPKVDVTLYDTDGDWLSDGDEGTFKSRASVADEDEDGLPDGGEAAAGTDPRNPDTDDDGVSDGDERTRSRSLPFGPPQEIAASSLELWVLAADLDGDGDDDVIVPRRLEDTVVWFENQGGGAWSGEVVIATGVGDVRRVIAEDLDRDDDLDVAVADLSGNAVSWFENLDGQGNFGDARVVDVGFASAYAVIAVDFDEDGDLDLAAASSRDPDIVWVENIDGSGVFGPARLITSESNGMSAEGFVGDIWLQAADIDRDGRVDLFSSANRLVRFSGTTRARLQWYRNLGGGNFAEGVELNGAPFGSADFQLTDMDGDGDLDAVIAVRFIPRFEGDTKGELGWLEHQGGGRFGPYHLIEEAFFGIESVFAADIDGDGDTDVLAEPVNFVFPLWHENLGTGTFAPATQINTNPQSPRVIASDVDGDGDADYITSRLVWLENPGTDPLNPDSDGDGLFDGFELQFGFDPIVVDDASLDPDFDGLNNLEEQTFGTNPFDDDTDLDGLHDGEEVHVHGTDPLLFDTDGDGLGDGAEVNELGTDPLGGDSDKDGLKDYDEVKIHKTDPMKADSDGDGWKDGAEVFAATNANDATSHPEGGAIAVPSLGPNALATLVLLVLAGGVANRRRRQLS